MNNSFFISVNKIKKAHVVFVKHELRDIFYRAAINLVEQSFNIKSELNLAESIFILLKTWNQAYYRYHKITDKHIDDIQKLLDEHDNLKSYRFKDIKSVCNEDREAIISIFKDFERILGPVGTAKCLHLISPNYFPIWDRKISASYKLPLTKTGTNGNKYFDFMNI